MAEGSIRQEFTLKNIDETRNYFIKEMKQNELISKKYEKICQLLRYIEHLFILASAVTGCVSISAFLSLVSFSAVVASSAVGIKICAITAVIKKYK